MLCFVVYYFLYIVCFSVSMHVCIGQWTVEEENSHLYQAIVVWQWNLIEIMGKRPIVKAAIFNLLSITSWKKQKFYLTLGIRKILLFVILKYDINA